MNKIIWDLDGVLRDFNIYFFNKYKKPYPQSYNEVWQNKNLVQWIEDDKFALINSPITEHVQIAKKYLPIEIWSSQYSHWLELTNEWLINNVIHFKFIQKSPQQKEKDLENLNGFLIEDSPNFRSYDKIILIDRPYNQHIKVKFRIHNMKQLDNLIKELTNE